MNQLWFRWVLITHLFLSLLIAGHGAHTDTSDPKAGALDSAEWIISESIKAHGGAVDWLELSFDFRDWKYAGQFKGGLYEMSRQFKKGDSLYFDKFNNRTFMRSINHIVVEVPEKKANAYTSSINSVFYFALLPFKLSDQAVQLRYVGKQSIAGETFYLVAVSFEKENGGEDYEDEYRYWINAQTMQLDYFAYSYSTGKGGVRFRSVEKRHKPIEGYILQDYINYKVNKGTNLDNLVYMHQNGKLEELSRIRLENIKIERIKK
ncbi:MAG: hypothetical protein CL840_02360 [Crocinitomicaceae bacterium]|nr:hypothetical protein [Crocinitomicaceae bacterium]|tara:strand:- start:1092 stop:1880 length:789 start_codon:yes stop_codon:yes gene_type:complete